jgi:hypothetical protein
VGYEAKIAIGHVVDRVETLEERSAKDEEILLVSDDRDGADLRVNFYSEVASSHLVPIKVKHEIQVRYEFDFLTVIEEISFFYFI